MTTTYDPHHPNYFDEDDLRGELDRVYDLCHGCRLCFKFCDSFPTLFDYIDATKNQDATKLEDSQRYHVVDECFNCKLCYINCPYTPANHEWELDFPRLMLRAQQVKHRNHKRKLSEKLTDQALGRTDLTGKIGSITASLTNRLISKPGSVARKLMQKTTGVSAKRILAPYSRQRFSTWFKNRTTAAQQRSEQGQPNPDQAIMFPTCLVEYSDTQIGKDFVYIAERNNIECSLPSGQQCCGAPFLHEGNVEQFKKQGAANVKTLADAIRSKQASGVDEPAVVVNQPTCGYVLKKDYVDYLDESDTADAELVAQHTYDASEYLMSIHKSREAGLDTQFSGDVPPSVTYHAPCHLRAQEIGLKSRDLLKLTGTKPKVVAECSGIDGMWGLRESNVEIARKVAGKLTTAINDSVAAGAETVIGDCSLANGGIQLETGTTPQHPLNFIADAYGRPEEPDEEHHGQH